MAQDNRKSLPVSESNSLYRGASPTELSHLFKLPLATVRDRLKDVAPSHKRGANDVYSVAEAAPYLIRVAEDDAEAIERILKMRHTDLPKMLAKEFWYAQTQKQKYELAAGDLWPTVKIVEFVGEAFKQMRLSLQLMSDTVDRQETLTEAQRLVIQRLVDSVLDDMREKMVDAFKNGRTLEVSGSVAPSQDDDAEEL